MEVKTYVSFLCVCRFNINCYLGLSEVMAEVDVLPSRIEDGLVVARDFNPYAMLLCTRGDHVESVFSIGLKTQCHFRTALNQSELDGLDCE